MFRYGILTGRIYEESIDPGEIGECCIMCNDDADLERAKATETSCELCMGCPECYREDLKGVRR